MAPQDRRNSLSHMSANVGSVSARSARSERPRSWTPSPAEQGACPLGNTAVGPDVHRRVS